MCYKSERHKTMRKFPRNFLFFVQTNRQTEHIKYVLFVCWSNNSSCSGKQAHKQHTNRLCGVCMFVCPNKRKFLDLKICIVFWCSVKKLKKRSSKNFCVFFIFFQKVGCHSCLRFVCLFLRFCITSLTFTAETENCHLITATLVNSIVLHFCF